MENTYKNPESNLFLAHTVEKRGKRHIEITFDTLILQKRERPFDWYKSLELDKSYSSKIRRGVIIPPRWLRTKIANYFGVDSTTIWFASEMILADGTKGGENEG